MLLYRLYALLGVEFVCVAKSLCGLPLPSLDGPVWWTPPAGALTLPLPSSVLMVCDAGCWRGKGRTAVASGDRDKQGKQGVANDVCKDLQNECKDGENVRRGSR